MPFTTPTGEHDQRKKLNPKPQPRLNRLRSTRRLTQAPCTTRARPRLLSRLATYAQRTRAHFTLQHLLLRHLGLYEPEFESPGCLLHCRRRESTGSSYRSAKR